MKSRLIILVLVGIFGMAITANSIPDKSDFVKYSRILPPGTQMLIPNKSGNSKGSVDTLSPTIPSNGPFWVWNSAFMPTYKVTKFTPASPCSVMQIWVGIVGMAGQTSKQCSVMVWGDGSVPGTRLYTQAVNFNTGGVVDTILWNKSTLTTPVYVSGSFWAGSKENDTLFPSTVLDTVTSLPAQISLDGSNWIADDSLNVSYLNVAVVKYVSGGGSAINVVPNYLILHIDSTAGYKGVKLASKPEEAPMITPAITEKDDAYWKDIIPGEVIIGYDNTIDVYKASTKELSIAGKGVTLLRKNLSSLNSVLVKVSENLDDMKEFIKVMEKNPHIKFAEPNRNMQLYGSKFTPNDYYFGSYQWDKVKLNCPAAWDLCLGDTSISIGVIDQGSQYTHPDLVARYGATKGYDFFSNDNDPMPASDQEEHGTHCSSNAASTINNSEGIAGIAQSRLYSLRCGSSSSVNLNACENAIAWCASNNVNVITMSWGSKTPTTSLQNALQNAWNNGCFLCASSGNDSSSTPTYPAAYSTWVVGVSAIGQSDQLAVYSDYGSDIELTAPGGDYSDGSYILAAVPTDIYGSMMGTSMAAPQVAGAAALVWSANHSLTNAQVRAILDSTAHHLGTAGRNQQFGYGRPDVYAAVQAAQSGGVTPSDTKMITVYNQASATGNLNVSAITYKASWIASVLPNSFSLSPNTSQGVTVIVSAKLHKGYYYDTLHIVSNDAQNPYLVPITLRVGNVGIEENDRLQTTNCRLQIYPNPAVKVSSIKYEVMSKSNVCLRLYNVAGRVVKTFVDGTKEPGSYTLNIDSKELSSGIYFISLKVGDSQINKKFIFTR